MSSYWLNYSKDLEKVSTINQDYNTDVCIIGAGITGLSTGYYLAKKGFKVIIVEKDMIGKKASGNTTAKITLAHGLIYDYLVKSFGEEHAKLYFESNKKAITNIKEIVDEEEIDCDFEIQSNYIYTTDDTEKQKIQNEVRTINKLAGNYEYAKYVTKCDLPFSITGAIKLDNQAQFHPVKYMYGLVKAIEKYGGKIFTNTTCSDVKEDNNGYITFAGKNKVRSQYVVITSHYPFINFPGLYFSKMYQVTSYAIAIETEKNVLNRNVYKLIRTSNFI